jgi:RNA polymerase sigma-70 factor, ECF subfamily
MKDPGVHDDGTSGATSSALLDRVQRQEQSAWERLVSLYSPLVYHWCLRYGLQRADVEEVCQDVFLAVARSIGKFRHGGERDTFRGWLHTITRNKILDHVPPPGGRGAGGSDAQDRLLQVPVEGPGEPDSNSADRDLGIVYHRAVELIEVEFEPNTRRAFWLVVAGRRAADVAAELGMSVGAVYIAKSRILRRLRDEFGDLLEERASDETEAPE